MTLTLAPAARRVRARGACETTRPLYSQVDGTDRTRPSLQCACRSAPFATASGRPIKRGTTHRTLEVFGAAVAAGTANVTATATVTSQRTSRMIANRCRS